MSECNAGCDLDVFEDNLCLACIDSEWYGVLTEFIIFFVAIGGLAHSSDHLCNSLETLCDHWRVPEDVGGATFMAFGSAIPEITVNFIAALRSVTERHQKKNGSIADLGVGAIMGSGLIAFLVIPPMCCFGSPANQDFLIKRKTLMRDMAVYAVALLVLIFSILTSISPAQSIFLLCMYALYITSMATDIVGRVRRRFFRTDSPLVLERQTSIFRERYESRQNSTADLGSGTRESSPVRGSSVEREIPGGSNAGTYAILEEDGNHRQAPHGMAREYSHSSDTSSDAGNVLQNTGTLNEPLASRSSVPVINGGVGIPPVRALKRWFKIVSRSCEIALLPITKVIDKSCPDCRILEGSHENWYPLTFLMAFIWISFFSFLTTVVVERFVHLLERPDTMGYFGLVLVAVGAEIPDTINAVTVAKRGYGSMATSSCIGSQVCNICVGLGLPWTILTLTGNVVSLGDHQGQMYLFHIALVVCLAVISTVMLLPGSSLWQQDDERLSNRGERMVLMTRVKAIVLLGLYVLFIGSITVSTFVLNSPITPPEPAHHTNGTDFEGLLPLDDVVLPEEIL